MSNPEPIADILQRVLPEIEKRVQPKDPKEGTKRALGHFLKGQKPKHRAPPA